MRVAITGGTGFVGSHAARALIESGHTVRLLVRSPEKAERVFANLGLSRPECVKGDIADAGAVEEVVSGCDALVHSAGVVAMEARHANEVLSTNLRGVENAMGGALRAGVGSIVYVSSVGALFQPNGPVVTADSPVMPGRSAYARSKSEAELHVRRLQEQGAPVHCVYPSAVLGPDDPGLSESMHALRTFCRDVVLLTSSGFQPVDVRDVAGVIARLVERPGSGRWVATARFLTWQDIADAIDSVTGARVRRIAVPGSLVRLGGYVCDAVKHVWDFDFPMTVEGMKFATQWAGADGTHTEAALGVRFRDPAGTIAEALRWMHRAGHIAPKHVGRLAEEGA
jgi:nucleoside-diphosphate-sugar epimerase